VRETQADGGAGGGEFQGDGSANAPARPGDDGDLVEERKS